MHFDGLIYYGGENSIQTYLALCEKAIAPSPIKAVVSPFGATTA